MVNLSYYKTDAFVRDPIFGTEGAACFDIHAHLKSGTVVKGYSESNDLFNQVVCDVEAPLFPGLEFVFTTTKPANSVIIPPNSRIMIPTGIILDIPKHFSVRVHSRSSMALKKGLRLANSEGVIDYDYFDPIFILLHNTTRENAVITDGDRIAQLEMVPMLQYSLVNSDTAAGQKTDRKGGWGSTGQ